MAYSPPAPKRPVGRPRKNPIDFSPGTPNASDPREWEDFAEVLDDLPLHEPPSDDVLRLAEQSPIREGDHRKERDIILAWIAKHNAGFRATATHFGIPVATAKQYCRIVAERALIGDHVVRSLATPTDLSGALKDAVGKRLAYLATVEMRESPREAAAVIASLLAVRKEIQAVERGDRGDTNDAPVPTSFDALASMLRGISAAERKALVAALTEGDPVENRMGPPPNPRWGDTGMGEWQGPADKKG